MEKIKSQILFFRFNVANLVYTLFVIAWGAFVRASGSGAGCGAHWPLCNGEVLPTSARLQTLIEFAHRSSSGISLVLVGIGCFLAYRFSEKKSPIRYAANFTVLAIILEAMLGAVLVLLRLVEFDQSVARAISISLHLMNTLFLLGTLVTLTFLSRKTEAYQTGVRTLFPKDRLFRGSLLMFVVLGVTGAIAALGDTLFKSPSLSYGLAQELSSQAHFLIRLRIFHPLFACVWVFLGFVWSQRLLAHARCLKIRAIFLTLLTIQFCLGLLNWALLAPTVLQLIHLVVADSVFMSFWLSGLFWSEEAT